MRTTRGACATVTSYAGNLTDAAATRYSNDDVTDGSARRNAPPPDVISIARHRSLSATSTRAPTGARFPTSLASITSGAPALIFALPGVTARVKRDGNSASDAASTAAPAEPRAT